MRRHVQGQPHISPNEPIVVWNGYNQTTASLEPGAHVFDKFSRVNYMFQNLECTDYIISRGRNISRVSHD